MLAFLVLCAGLALSTASTFPKTLFTLQATSSPVKGQYVNVSGKIANVNATGEATGIFTSSSKNADLFYVDQLHQIHLYYDYNNGKGPNYEGIVDEDKDNPADEGFGTLYFSNIAGPGDGAGVPVLCPHVYGPAGQISQFVCILNPDYFDGWANVPFSWAIVNGSNNVIISAQGAGDNFIDVTMIAKVVRTL